MKLSTFSISLVLLSVFYSRLCNFMDPSARDTFLASIEADEDFGQGPSAASSPILNPSTSRRRLSAASQAIHLKSANEVGLG